MLSTSPLSANPVTAFSIAVPTEIDFLANPMPDSGSTNSPDATTPPKASTGTPTLPSADTVYLYLTTNATAGSGGNTFLQLLSTNSAYGLNLTAPLVVAGTARSKFVVDATGKVDGANGPCGMNPPVFGFQKM